MESAGLCLAQSFAALDARGSKAREMEIKYEQTTIIARDLGNAFEAVAIAPNANRAMLRMALNVWAATFENDADLQNSLKAAAKARSDVLSSTYLDDDALKSVQQFKHIT